MPQPGSPHRWPHVRCLGASYCLWLHQVTEENPTMVQSGKAQVFETVNIGGSQITGTFVGVPKLRIVNCCCRNLGSPHFRKLPYGMHETSVVGVSDMELAHLSKTCNNHWPGFRVKGGSNRQSRRLSFNPKQGLGFEV